MSIHELIRRGKGRTHGWRVERAEHEDGTTVAELWHYSTRMLAWNIDDPHDAKHLDWDLGWGSVSDQNGMNTAFRVLGLPYRYDRAGGANVVDLREERAERERREQEREARAWEADKETMRKRGYRDGLNAGAWVLDGRSSEQDAREILRGIEDGDPQVLDVLPSPDFSGQWAGDPSFEDLCRDEGVYVHPDGLGDSVLLNEHRDGYAEGVEAEASRSARAMLGEEV